MKSNFNKLILLIFCICYSPIAFASKSLTLPKPTGSFAIGTKAIEMRDSSRTMLRGNDPRRWMVQAFYPSEEHDETYPYMPGTLDNGIVQGTKVLSYAKPNAAPLKSQRYPVIIFVPGRGGERQKYTILCEELASQGYVVLTLDQPYASNFVKFLDGTRIVLTLQDAWKVPKDRDYRYSYDDKVIEGAIKDVIYMLDHLNEVSGKELGNICDFSHIILMGHSLGANVAHILGFQDERIKAVVDIDSKITERKIFDHVGVPPNPSSKPVLFIRGMMQYQDDVGDQLTKIQNSTIWKPFVQHSAFSDNAYFSAKIQNFGTQGFLQNFLNWFFKQAPYRDRIDTDLGDNEVDAWFTTYKEHVVEWLKVKR